MKNTKWSQNEIDLIYNNFKLGYNELYKLLPNRTKTAISTQCGRLGLTRQKIFNWNKHFLEIKRLWEINNLDEIKEKFPELNLHAALEYLRKRGITRNLNPGDGLRKGTLAPLLQETLEAYYWAGYIAADGWISKTGQVVVVTSEKDKDHLEKLAIFLKTSISIIDKKLSGFATDLNMARIAVQDITLGKQFAKKFNFHHQKTYNPPNIEWIKGDYFWSFFIGFIDGDGSIFKSGKLKNSITCKVENHISWFKVLDYFKIELYKQNKIDPAKWTKTYISKRGYASIGFTNKILLNFLARKAKNLPVLTRKWSLINEFIS